MVRNSTADRSDFVRGVAAVLAELPGVAFLCDAEGNVLYGNGPYCSDQAKADGSADPEGRIIPAPILSDVLGTDQPGYHSLVLPSGRKTGVSCRRIVGAHMAERYVMVREDARQGVVAKFVSAQEGVLNSRIERDRARAKEERLKAEASHWRLMSMSDRLTGLYNAPGFRDRVGAALGNHPIGAMVYADLNGFKQVNDSLGHAAGDSLLQDIGQALQSVIRGGDVAGRLGGDEFAVFLPNCPEDELSKVVARLRKAMSRRIPVNRGGDRPSEILSVTPAIGTAVYPDDSDSLDDLLHLADARMYADKAAGKGRRREA